MAVSGSSWRMTRAASSPSFVGERHPDVGHYQLRPGLAGQRVQPRAVACLPHYVIAGALGQTGQALSEQDIILGQKHPLAAHGATVTVPPGPADQGPGCSCFALSTGPGRSAGWGHRAGEPCRCRLGPEVTVSSYGGARWGPAGLHEAE
jgi:hypothetical protein